MPPSYNLNERLYLDINKFARETPWAHPFMSTYSHYLGVTVLAILLLVAWWVARSDSSPDVAVANVLWAAGGTVLAWGAAHYILKPLVGEERPYITLPHVEVLLTRTNGFSFPSGHATVAGAVIAGLWMSRRKIIALCATALGLFLAFGRVYTGMHYLGDVLGGLLFGAIFIVVLHRPAISLLDKFVRIVWHSKPFGILVEKNETSDPKLLKNLFK